MGTRQVGSRCVPTRALGGLGSGSGSKVDATARVRVWTAAGLRHGWSVGRLLQLCLLASDRAAAASAPSPVASADVVSSDGATNRTQHSPIAAGQPSCRAASGSEHSCPQPASPAWSPWPFATSPTSTTRCSSRARHSSRASQGRGHAMTRTWLGPGLGPGLRGRDERGHAMTHLARARG